MRGQAPQMFFFPLLLFHNIRSAIGVLDELIVYHSVVCWRLESVQIIIHVSSLFGVCGCWWHADRTFCFCFGFSNLYCTFLSSLVPLPSTFHFVLSQLFFSVCLYCLLVYYSLSPVLFTRRAGTRGSRMTPGILLGGSNMVFWRPDYYRSVDSQQNR